MSGEEGSYVICVQILSWNLSSRYKTMLECEKGDCVTREQGNRKGT